MTSDSTSFDAALPAVAGAADTPGESTPGLTALERALERERAISPWRRTLKQMSPRTMERIDGVRAAANATGALPERIAQLIYIGIDTVVTHLYPPGLETHIRGAIHEGVTPQQILETLQIASSVSNHSYGPALAAVADELAKAGRPLHPGRSLGPAEIAFKQRFLEHNGFWEPWMEQALLLTPGYAKALLSSDYPPETHLLPERDRALIALGISASPAVGDADQVELHTRRALQLGASDAEILQAIQLTGNLGAHAVTMGIIPLMKLMAEATAHVAEGS